MTKRYEALLPGLAIGLLLLLHLHLAITRSINWDEFHYLSQIHDQLRGDLSRPIQTLHVRLFGWLPGLSSSGIDQIILGRAAMFGFELVTCINIFLISRRFADRAAALVCVLAYLAFPYVMQHGWSFRSDPIAIALCMSSMTLMLYTRLTFALIAAFALMMGTAALLTIKIALLLPCFMGLAYLRWHDESFKRSTAFRIAIAPLGAIAVAAAIFITHSSDLASTDAAGKLVVSTGSSAFFLGKPDYLPYLLKSISLYSSFYLVLIFALVKNASSTQFSRAEKVALLSLAAPLLSIAFYQNTLPYFYAFMMAPVCVALAPALSALIRHFSLTFATLVFVAYAALFWSLDGPSQQDKQRELQAAAERIFAEPVVYIDFPGFLPGHRKANFFMTTWNIKKYVNREIPSFEDVLKTRIVPLMLTIDPDFNPTMQQGLAGPHVQSFLHPSDQEALASTYREFWGPYHLAGVKLERGQMMVWDVRVPGPYQVEGAMRIGGEPHSDGAVVELPRGEVTLEAVGEGAGLIWGESTQLPLAPAPQRPYWTDF